MEPSQPEVKKPEDGTQAASAVFAQRADDVIDIRFLFKEYLRRWWVILAFIAVGIYSGVGVLHNHVAPYQALMLVKPTENIDSRGSQSKTGNVISSFAGISLGSKRESAIFERMNVLSSSLTMARLLDEKHGLLKKVYGGSWDQSSQSWKRPTGDRFEWNERINAYLRQPTWAPPTLEDLSGYIGGAFKIESIPDSNFTRIKFTHGDPDKALYMLKTVYDEVSEYIHREELEEQVQRRRYLESQLRQTQIVEFRTVYIDLLAGVTGREMALKSGPSSKLRVLDPPYVSKNRLAPNIVQVMGVRLLASLAVALIILTLVAVFRSE